MHFVFGESETLNNLNNNKPGNCWFYGDTVLAIGGTKDTRIHWFAYYTKIFDA